MIALMIIDQQQGIDSPRLGQRNNTQAQAIMLSLLSRWRQHQWPVIHVRHKSQEPNSVFWPQQPGYEFKPEFTPNAAEILITKSVPCAFINTDLAQQLRERNIQQIAITGASTNNSIEASARTAGMLGFKVQVIEDACFAFAKTDYFGTRRTAEEVHAMSLANLQGEYAEVIDSQVFLHKV